jgi:hypothetical protein
VYLPTWRCNHARVCFSTPCNADWSAERHTCQAASPDLQSMTQRSSEHQHIMREKKHAISLTKLEDSRGLPILTPNLTCARSKRKEDRNVRTAPRAS